MWYRSPRLFGRLRISGAPGGVLTPVFGLAQPADANIHPSTRTSSARPEFAARPSIFERPRRPFHGGAVRAWSRLNDNAHADRRAPPGRDQGGRGQGKPDRGI